MSDVTYSKNKILILGTCFDMDYLRSSDKKGLRCNGYDKLRCGKYDNIVFKSQIDCCICGGGTTSKLEVNYFCLMYRYLVIKQSAK